MFASDTVDVLCLGSQGVLVFGIIAKKQQSTSAQRKLPFIKRIFNCSTKSITNERIVLPFAAFESNLLMNKCGDFKINKDTRSW